MKNPLTGAGRRIAFSVLALSMASVLSVAAPLQAAKTSGAASNARPTAQSQPAKPTSANAKSSTDDSGKLDINTASMDELKALPGVGDAYAKRIIDGRPYAAKNQLTQRGILPQKTYDAIKENIIAHRVAKK